MLWIIIGILIILWLLGLFAFHIGTVIYILLIIALIILVAKLIKRA